MNPKPKDYEENHTKVYYNRIMKIRHKEKILKSKAKEFTGNRPALQNKEHTIEWNDIRWKFRVTQPLRREKKV